MAKQKLLFIEVQNDVSFWKDELIALSKEYDVTAISYSASIEPEYGCVKYLAYSRPKNLFRYACRGLGFFFSSVGYRELKDIWHNKNVNRFRCLIKAIFYFGEMQLFGDYIKNNLEDFAKDAIIYTYWCHVYTLYFALNRKKYNTPGIITRMHRFDLYEDERNEGRQPFRWLINENVDRIVLCGENNRDYYLRQYRLKDDSKVLINRLGCNELILNDDTLVRGEYAVLVSCAHINKRKRVDMIVKALANIDDIKIRWIHFGNNELGEEFTQFCEESLSDKENIEYELKGYVSSDRIRQYYADNHVDCFITTSSSEGAPVSIMEAMSIGIPIIGTDVGDISNMIDGNGVLLDENPSIEDVVKAITDMMMLSDEVRETMRVRSIDIWREKYNTVNNVQDFLEIVKSL